MNKIVITCGGGLGNRLLGLASAMVLAEKHKAELQAFWPQGEALGTGTAEGFHGSLGDLYHPPCDMLAHVELNEILLRPHLHYSLQAQRQLSPMAPEGVTYYYTHGAIRGAATSEELNAALSKLHPSRNVRDRIATAKVLMDGYNYHGLLVRGHGHPKARRWNPAVKFKTLLQQAEPACFYLCCDDHDVAAKLMSGSRQHRFVALPRQWKRNSAAELATVAADFAMLRECNCFYSTPFCAMTELVKILRPGEPCTYPE